MPGDQGQATGKTPLGNVTISWVYCPVDLTLTIGAIKKPRLLPNSVIEKKITALVEAAKPGVESCSFPNF